MMIAEYLHDVQIALAAYQWVRSVKVLRCDVEETDLQEILVYRFRVMLQDDGLLEMMERVVYSKTRRTLQVTTYNYHWQDKYNRLVTRWDNAPHFHFPDHIHLGKDNTIIPGKPMTALEMLAMVAQEKALSER
jgi:hypothetical protein